MDILYVNLIGCDGVAEIYGQLEEGVGSVCHRYMCMLLYVKLIGVMVLHRFMLDRCRSGASLPWVYVHSSICEPYWV